MKRPLWQLYLTAASFSLALACTTQAAVIITPTGGTSGGNPGGQSLFEVSGLVAGDMFDVSWSGPDDVAAEAKVTIDSLSATNVEISVMIENLSAPNGGGGDPRITAFGLDLDGASGVNASAGGTEIDNAFYNSNFPGFSDINVCGTSGANCAGGGSGGIDVGLSDTFTLDVQGNFGATLLLSDFGLKVQGAAGGSYELAGHPTPEPSTVAIAAVAAGAILMYRRLT